MKRMVNFSEKDYNQFLLIKVEFLKSFSQIINRTMFPMKLFGIIACSNFLYFCRSVKLREAFNHSETFVKGS